MMIVGGQYREYMIMQVSIHIIRQKAFRGIVSICEGEVICKKSPVTYLYWMKQQIRIQAKTG